MDIHQIMQMIGQILYVIITELKVCIQELSDMVGGLLQNINIPSSPTVIKLFSNTAVNRVVFFIAAVYILLMNIWAFALYGIDKRNAIRRKLRISERKLIRVCAWGGAGGGLFGMLLFRHKTKHKKFSVSVPILFAIQLILDSFILGFLGFWAFF